MTAQTARAAADLTGKRPANTRPATANPPARRQQKAKRHPLINNGQSGSVVLITLLCVCMTAVILGVVAALLTG